MRFHLEQLETEAREEEDRAKGLKLALEAVEKVMQSLGHAAPAKSEKLDDLVESLFSTYPRVQSPLSMIQRLSQLPLPWGPVYQ